MRIIYALLFILPFTSNAQCPELIGKPVGNAQTFFKKVQQLTGTDFRDSLILQDRFTYSDEESLKCKIFANGNVVKSINVEGSKEQVQQVFDWIEKEYAACTFTKGEQWLKFGDVNLYWKDESSKKRSLFISAL